MNSTPTSPEEALALLETITLLAVAAGVPEAALKRSTEPLLAFLKRLPDEEASLVELRDVFEEGAKAYSHTLSERTYHPESTGLWNPYGDSLRMLLDDREKAAAGWLPVEELYSDDFELPVGMKIEWDTRAWEYRRWGRLVPEGEPDDTASMRSGDYTGASRLRGGHRGW